MGQGNLKSWISGAGVDDIHKISYHKENEISGVDEIPRKHLGINKNKRYLNTKSLMWSNHGDCPRDVQLGDHVPQDHHVVRLSVSSITHRKIITTTSTGWENMISFFKKKLKRIIHNWELMLIFSCGLFCVFLY